jgi:hypothetical protein
VAGALTPLVDQSGLVQDLQVPRDREPPTWAFCAPNQGPGGNLDPLAAEAVGDQCLALGFAAARASPPP